MKIRALLVASLLTSGAPLFAETVVTTYVVKTQEQRASTRWTLTEWLHVKERMKLMDVWLAMFSDPQKDRFRPELNLSYGLLQADVALATSDGETKSGSMNSQSLKGQLWLTNILTGTVGVRSLNIDLGFEAGSKGTTSPYSQSETDTTEPAALSLIDADALPRKHSTEYGSANLRIFGKNIQDTSLVLKYGKYSLHNSMLGTFDDATVALTKEGVTVSQDGVLAGAEMQLYLLKFLGAEATYHAYGGKNDLSNKQQSSGNYHEYLAFVEVSFIRFMVGRYQENWTLKRPIDQKKFESSESGTFTGVKVQF